MKISQYLELPRKMRDARLKAGLSQQFIAKELGISQQSYARYENGIADPTIETLEIFCREVHVTIPELLGIMDPLTGREPITTFSDWIYVLNELENHGITIKYGSETDGYEVGGLTTNSITSATSISSTLSKLNTALIYTINLILHKLMKEITREK